MAKKKYERNAPAGKPSAKQDPDAAEDYDDVESKSAKKRAMTELQGLGEKAAQLDSKEITELQLSETLSQALCDANTISAREGKRRHFQFIGKLMRKESAETIESLRQFLHARDHNHHLAVEKEKTINAWRDRLLDEGDSAIQALVERYEQADRAQLRALTRSAKKELIDGKPPSNYRKLYQRLKEILD